MADYLNASLIGVPGSRWQLQTPALVVDLDILERNIAKMAEHAKAHGISLRPHAKTHKSVEIAKRQLAAGALGQCCAKLGEAEALAAGGIDGILLTSPVVTTGGVARLMALNSRMNNLMATCDNLEIAKRLNAAATSAGKPLQVVVDIDPGMSRTGIRPDGGAVELVEFVTQAEGLTLAGLQCYAGQAQHMESPNERRSASLGVMSDFGKLRDTLKAKGITPPLMSGGGTGTFDIDVDAKVLTELQVGSYVFMDRQYNDVWEKPGERTPFETSLFVHTSVISANREGLATTDAGLKAFATDAEPPRIAAGAPDGATYFFFGDEQGGIIYPRDGKKLTHGDQLACVVPHCDPTVNLYDCYHAVRGDTLEAIWPVDARGRSA
ncbi:MAG TPA: DSD1 family PLP-dependent enzyme [Rhizomicrobium sp.]|jgi:D-serine deaminase-like pyridoxal phosphate-dependent protein|nr:DSD1 family PLP-dependent enzyme [Rhizomicrobium sp.]